MRSRAARDWRERARRRAALDASTFSRSERTWRWWICRVTDSPRCRATDAAKIAELLADYLRERRQLAALVMLIDARRGPEREELELASAVRERGLELIVVGNQKRQDSQRGAPGDPAPVRGTRDAANHVLRLRRRGDGRTARANSRLLAANGCAARSRRRGRVKLASRKMNPEVSVIIPTYNRRAMVREAVASVWRSAARHQALSSK